MAFEYEKYAPQVDGVTGKQKESKIFGATNEFKYAVLTLNNFIGGPERFTFDPAQCNGRHQFASEPFTVEVQDPNTGNQSVLNFFVCYDTNPANPIHSCAP